MKTSDVVPARLLRWIFRRGTDTLVCQVSCYGARSYGLIVAASDERRAGCELFTSRWTPSADTRSWRPL